VILSGLIHFPKATVVVTGRDRQRSAKANFFMLITIYGNKNCATIKPARARLNKRIIDGVMGTIEWE
jgi:hypothetical protein